MVDLLHSCSESLVQAEADCATEYGERVSQIILTKDVITASGNVPTSSEIKDAYDAGTAVILSGITGGHRLFRRETVIEWNNKEYYDPVYTVEGKIRKVSEAIARLCEKMNYYNELYLYYITDKFYCFGPYIGYPSFSLIQSEGKGVPPYISFDIEFVHRGIDYSNYDANYEDFTNLGYLLLESGGYILLESGGRIII